MSITINGSGQMTFNDGSVQSTAYDTNKAFGFKNRIINGKMEICQRYGSAVISPLNGYAVDRWSVSGGGTVPPATAQQVFDAPVGFTTSLKVTVTSAKTTINANETAYIYQPIEGRHVFDLQYGYATAKTTVLSFWVKSSVVGTFGGFVRNSNAGRNPPAISFVFNYTVNSANTWEYKTIVVPGCTAGSTNNDSNEGLAIMFNLYADAAHTTTQANVGTWVTGDFYTSSNCTNLFATNGATIQFTGVQFEVGNAATPFEHRHTTQETMLCRRYFIKMGDTTDNYALGRYINYSSTTSNGVGAYFHFGQNMRIVPSISGNYDISDGNPINFTTEPMLVKSDGVAIIINIPVSSFADIRGLNISAEM